MTVPGRHVTGVLLAGAAEYASLESQLAPVVSALAVAARVVAPVCPGEAVAALQIKPMAAHLIPPAWNPWSADLCRVDFLLHQGRPVVVEANFGAAVGGSIDVEAFEAAACRLRDLGARQAPNRARIQWAAALAAEHGVDELFLPLWPWSHIENPAAYFGPSVQVAAECGVDLRLISFDEFETLIRRSKGTVVALKLFATMDAIRLGWDLGRIGYGPPGRVVWLQSEEVAVLSNKALMASRYFESSMASRDSRIAPETRLVSDAGDARFLVTTPSDVVLAQQDLVLKPLDEHGGNGVMLGAHSHQDDWKRAVSMSGIERMVSQVNMVPDEVDVGVRQGEAGPTTRIRGAAVYGAFFVKDRMHGVLARVATPGMLGRPINASGGAVMTALLPASL